MTQQKPTKINQLTGKLLGVGPLSYNFLLVILIAGAIIGFFWLLGLVSAKLGGFLFFSFTTSFFFLAGDKAWRFFEKFTKARRLYRAAPKIDWNFFPGLPVPEKMQLMSTKFRGERGKLHPVEGEFDLVGYGTAEISNPGVGFYVTIDRKGAAKSQKPPAFTFVWEVRGYDPNIIESEARQALDSQETMFRRLKPNYWVTFEHSSTSDDFEYQHSLDQQIQQTSNPLVKALLYSKKAKVRELQKQGLFQEKRTRIFIRFQSSVHSAYYINGLLDRVMMSLTQAAEFVLSLLDQDQPIQRQRQQQNLFKLFVNAYKEYLHLHGLLNGTGGFDARSLTQDDLWRYDYHELHNLEAPPPNQVIVLTRTKVKVNVRSQVHVLAQLFQPENTVDPTPQLGDEWVYLPVKRKYVSYLQVGKLDTYPPDDGIDRGKIRYLCNPMFSSGYSDYKILTQLCLSFQEGQRFDLGRQVRNSKRLVAKAAVRYDVNIEAENRYIDADEGLRNLSSGSKVYETATAICMYRNNPEALTNNFTTLSSLISTPNTERTFYAAEYTWFQSFPFASKRLLTYPYKRLHDYYSHELPGLLPLVSPLTLDKQGLFFLTREGFSPFFIDLFTSLTHLAIFGTTRAGKSVVLGEIIAVAFSLLIPVVVFDYPKETTGDSTFTDLTSSLRRVGGSAGYNNISDCYINLMQMPDLRNVPEQEDRRSGVLDFQLRALMVLVMGELADPQSMHEQIFKQSVKNLLSQCLNCFHDDHNIKQRYYLAISSGHGTPEHANEPTLVDYANYFSSWFQEYMQDSSLFAETDKEAGAFIVSQLRGLLGTKLGASISHPSTFESDVSLLVFALKGITDNYQAAVYALAGYSALLQHALSQPACILVLDECPILFEFPAISKIVAQLCANGLKWGVRVVLSGQTPGTIYRSAGGDKIRDTVTKILLGQIVPEAVLSFVDLLGFRHDVIAKYGSDSCRPNKSQLRSYWCLKQGDKHVDLFYQPSNLLLSLLANNRDEQSARDLFFAAYPDDPLKAISEFSKAYIPALASGDGMQNVKPKLLPSVQLPRSA